MTIKMLYNSTSFDEGVAKRWVSPLRGKRIINTRAIDQAGELNELLEMRGAEVLAYPCLRFELPDNTSALDDAMRKLAQNEFNWLILTSANVVKAIAQRFEDLQLELPANPSWRIITIGSKTAQAAQSFIPQVIPLIPDDSRAEVLPDFMRNQANDTVSFKGHSRLHPKTTKIHAAPKPMMGTRILLPQADIASSDLADALAGEGANLTHVVAYRTVKGSGGVHLPILVADRYVDALTFASPSAVRYFMARFFSEGGNMDDLHDVAVVCIGPTTLQCAVDCGFAYAVAPTVYTLEMLVQVLEEILA